MTRKIANFKTKINSFNSKKLSSAIFGEDSKFLNKIRHKKRTTIVVHLIMINYSNIGSVYTSPTN